MKLFFNYLRSHIIGILEFLLFCSIFAGFFYLYNLPLSPVLYSSSICAFLWIVILFVRYRSYVKKNRHIKNLIENFNAADLDFPKCTGENEIAYQELATAIYNDKKQLENDFNRRYSELVNYYTTWVHQIKTPIASMKLNLQYNDSDQNRELLDDLQRIEQYVEMVLCYIRLDPNSSDYVIKQYQLDVIIKQAVKKFANQFIRKKISLIYTPVDVKVLTDEKWLTFVLEQVISNALKYTKSGSISITVEADKVLCIRDTDIGIAPEDLPRIFESGFTGYNGRSDKKASGLGLFLCRRICRNLGHEIYAESALGSGTVIRINLASKDLEIE